MTLKREAKIGLFVVIAMLMFYASVRFAKGMGIVSSYGKNSYYVIYEKGGLRAGDGVYINDILLGRVDKITFLKEGFRARVDFSIRKDIEITDRVTAVLTAGNLLAGRGRNSIELIYESPDGKIIEKGSQLPGAVDIGFTNKIVESTIPVLNDIKATTALIGELTRGLASNQEKINSAITNLELMTYTLKDYIIQNKSFFDKITRNISKILTVVADDKKGIGPLIETINITSKKISSLELNEINKSIKHVNEILGKINSSNSSIGRILTDDEIYRNLNKTIYSLDKLVVNLRNEPGRYVRFSLFGGRTRKRNVE